VICKLLGRLCVSELFLAKNPLPTYGTFIKDATSGAKLKTHMETLNGKGIVEQHPLDLQQYSIAFSKEEVLLLIH
jgi:hypothetical protein